METDSFHFDELSDSEGDEGVSLRRSKRTKKQTEQKQRGKHRRKAAATRSSQPRTSRVAAPLRKKKKSRQENHAPVAGSPQNQQSKKTPVVSKKTRSMLQSPSPLKALAISPIETAPPRRKLRSSYDPSHSLPQHATIFTPAQDQLGIAARRGTLDAPVPLKDAEVLSPPQHSSPSPPRQHTRGGSRRYGSKRRQEGQQSEGSPAQASTSSDTSDEYLEVYNPGLKDRIKAQQAKAHKKTKKEVAEETARQEELQRRNQAKVDAAKAFYAELDAEPLDQFFVMR